MTIRRLTRADVDREHTLEWLMARDAAETGRCPTCRAAPGITCRNVHTGRPVTGQPAHLARLAGTTSPSAQQAPAMPRPRDPSSSTSPPASASSVSLALAA